jgi:hypothetical protein
LEKPLNQNVSGVVDGQRGAAARIRRSNHLYPGFCVPEKGAIAAFAVVEFSDDLRVIIDGKDTASAATAEPLEFSVAPDLWSTGRLLDGDLAGVVDGLGLPWQYRQQLEFAANEGEGLRLAQAESGLSHNAPLALRPVSSMLVRSEGSGSSRTPEDCIHNAARPASSSAPGSVPAMVVELFRRAGCSGRGMTL